MAAQPSSTPGRRPARLSRDSIVNAALTFLDREGWDALTINALATQLGTKGPSLYSHVQSLEDLRRTVRMHVVGDIIEMLNTVGQGRTRDDAVMAMASAYRSYAHHHPGRYSAFTRMPLGGDEAFYAALEFWSAMHGFVLLEMTGAMNGIDTDAVFTDMVMRLATGMERR